MARELESMEMECPLATHDVEANLANRQNAIDEYGYGPADPSQPNTKFWAAKSKMWDGADTKSMRCGNCASFIQTPSMLACIEEGIDEDSGEYAPAVVDAAGLGYCALFEFKCAADRTCDAWLTGGPITKEMTGKQTAILEFAKKGLDE
jgi:hypothetical protein